MDKDKSLKNSNEGGSVDTKGSEKEGNLLDINTSSGKSGSNAESSADSSNSKSCCSSACSSSYSLDLAVLNEISKIAQMAMSSISCLTKKFNDVKMKQELLAIYSQYSNILLQVNQHFEKYGEIPDDTPFSTKISSYFGIKMNVMKDRSNSHIAEMMIQGSLMGIIECQKIINSDLNIDKSTKDLLKDFVKFQRQNIDKLNSYL